MHRGRLMLAGDHQAGAFISSADRARSCRSIYRCRRCRCSLRAVAALQRRGQRPGELFHIAGAQRQAMIGFGAGRRWASARPRTAGSSSSGRPLTRRRAENCRAYRRLPAPAERKSASSETTTFGLGEIVIRVDGLCRKPASRRRARCAVRPAPTDAISLPDRASGWSSNCSAMVGEVTVSVRMRKPAPFLPFCSASMARKVAEEIAPGADFALKASAPASGPDRTAAAPMPARNMSQAPSVPGCSGLPSTLVGRPSWLSTSSAVGDPAQRGSP